MERQPYFFDLHGHTNQSLPEIVPYDYRDAIRRAKLLGVGIAFTEHNTLRGLRKALEEAERQEIILVPGAEISDRSFRGICPTSHHILALGIDPDRVRTDRVPVLRPPPDIINWIHDSGGVAIGVHARPAPTFMSMSYEQLEKLALLFDGMEVINGRDLLEMGWSENRRMKELASKYRLAQIGGSDFHRLSSIGVVATKVFIKCEKWQDVIEAIKQRQVEPFIRSTIPIGL